MQIKDALKFDNCKNYIPRWVWAVQCKIDSQFQNLKQEVNRSGFIKLYLSLIYFYFSFQPQTTLYLEVQGLKLPRLVQLLRILRDPMKTKSVLKIIMISQFLLNQVRTCFYHLKINSFHYPALLWFCYFPRFPFS